MSKKPIIKGMTLGNARMVADALGKAKRAKAYLLDPNVKIWNERHKCFVTKEYGSNLAYLYRAIETLENLLGVEPEP